jgi:hypothetical protein
MEAYSHAALMHWFESIDALSPYSTKSRRSALRSSRAEPSAGHFVLSAAIRSEHFGV